jgi:hypothetical protein
MSVLVLNVVMLNVANKPLMLSVIVQNVMLSVIVQNVMLSVTNRHLMLNIIMLSAVAINAETQHNITLSISKLDAECR